MKGLNGKLAVMLLLIMSGFLGFIKGPVAKQKWMVKRKSKSDIRKQIAENKSIVRKGGVVLDDIELAAYHK